jgi:hypothetical protein
LLSKIDGVDSLNNILIIGMTNRKDMIDDAILRPGRLELHIEITLPSEEGRIQILNIHTASMKANKRVAQSALDRLPELAGLTKNFTGDDDDGDDDGNVDGNVDDGGDDSDYDDDGDDGNYDDDDGGGDDNDDDNYDDDDSDDDNDGDDNDDDNNNDDGDDDDDDVYLNRLQRRFYKKLFSKRIHKNV